MFLWLVLVMIVMWTGMYRYKRRRMYKLASQCPSAGPELPLIGHARLLSGTNEGIVESLKKFSYKCIRNDGLAVVWLNHILYYFKTDPVDTEMLLKHCLEKDDLHRFIRNILGYGIVFAPVPIWRRRRKILMPAFTPKIVESFVGVFSEQSEKLVKSLQEYANNGHFSIWRFISAYTLESICETSLGVNINAQGNPNTPVLVSMTTALGLACKRMFHLWLQPDWLFKLSPFYKKHEESIQALHLFTDDIIRKKRDEISIENKLKTEADKNIDVSNYKNTTFLDLLIKFSGGETGYTNEELREEVLTIILAGTDTSAAGIVNTLMLLAKYPEIQEKAYRELYDVFGDSDRPIEKKDIPRLEYLTRVLKESLRLFPPAPFVVRKILEDVTLPSGRTISGGSGVVVSIWGMHRDPKYCGPNAEKFDPDRFLPERLQLPHACNFMPFSQGPRNCPGYQYALMSMKSALSTVLRRYRVVGEAETTAVPRIRVQLDVIMKAVDGYQVAFERRKVPTASL